MTDSQALIPQNGSELIQIEADPFEAIIHLVTDGMTSEHSRRAYAKALQDFLSWRDHEGRLRSPKP